MGKTCRKLDPQSGLTAFFISRDDLIASKLAAGRMRDLADVEEMRDATESLVPGSKRVWPAND